MSRMPDNISLLRASTDTRQYDSGGVYENTLLGNANLFYPYVVDNSGHTGVVSLTIDVLNKDDLTYANEIPDGNWSTNDRKRKRISNLDAIWGFKETSHASKPSRAISNAFCMDGQQLTFYVGAQGHSTGYIDDQWVYGHTSIVASTLNLGNGEQSVLFTFDGFEDDEDDSGRYFTWNVPLKSDALFNKYGLFGLHVIKLDITTTYYEDAEKSVALSDSHPNKDQALLQLLVYNGAREFIDVDAGDLDIFTIGNPYATDKLNQLFSKTMFETLSGSSQNGLTTSQKRAIMADQAAVLFMSQHPVISATYYPSKILGIGAESATAFTKNVDKSISHGERYDVIVDMAINRLFGMLASYKAFNYIVDFEEYFTDFEQSTQTLRDPLKSFVIDGEGSLSQDYGVNGLAFNPYVQELHNAEFMDSSLNEIIMNVPLYDGNIDIGNILITDHVGSDLETGGSVVKVAFDVNAGESYIKSLKYHLFTLSDPNFYSKENFDGTSRTASFGLISPLSLYETIYAKIIVEDTEGNVQIFTASDFIKTNTSSVEPAIYGLVVYQSEYGSDFINIYYIYDGNGEINNSSLTLEYSINNGSSWSSLSATLYGDHGVNVMPGHRHIVWDISSDLALVDISADVLVKLTLKDIDNVTAIGQTTSSRLTWSLEKPIVALKRLFEDELREEIDHSTSSSSFSSASTESEGNTSSSSTSSTSVGTSSSFSSSSEGISSSSSVGIDSQSSESEGNVSSSSSSSSSRENSSSSSSRIIDGAGIGTMVISGSPIFKVYA